MTTDPTNHIAVVHSMNVSAFIISLSDAVSPLLRLILLLLAIALSVRNLLSPSSRRRPGPRRTPSRLPFVLFLALLSSGCGVLIPQEHKEQVAVRTAGELEASHNDTVTKRSAIPQITLRGGWGNHVTIKVPQSAIETLSDSQATTTSTGSDSATGWRWSKMPLWVKLVGLALGLAVLFFILRYIWRAALAASPAFAALASRAESAAEVQIKRL